MKKGLQRERFSVNFAKYLETQFLKKIFGDWFCNY